MPLKKSNKAEKSIKKSENLKRRASDGACGFHLYMLRVRFACTLLGCGVYMATPCYSSDVLITPASEEPTSPTQVKRIRLDSELLAMDPALYRSMGLKKSEIKRLKKEKERLDKRAAKDRERKEVAERKRMRGE